jgi:hypothetical protein
MVMMLSGGLREINILEKILKIWQSIGLEIGVL